MIDFTLYVPVGLVVIISILIVVYIIKSFF